MSRAERRRFGCDIVHAFKFSVGGTCPCELACCDETTPEVYRVTLYVFVKNGTFLLVETLRFDTKPSTEFKARSHFPGAKR